MLASGATSMLVGCANITVSKVIPQNDSSVPGIRYCLPKPFIQAVPQADGSIAVDVVYLPDTSHTYAIDTSTWMASSTFQVALDAGGGLTAVEFKQNNSVVGQQAALSAGAAAAQTYNAQAAQLVAAQTAVNTAQSSVDSLQAAADAAQAQLEADTASKASAATLATDTSNLAQTKAKLQDAQQVLARVKNTPVVVAGTAAAATPLSSSPPTPGTTGFGPQTWTTPSLYTLPENHGAVLYAINEGGTLDPDSKSDTRFVSLKAVANNGKTQPDFATVGYALGAPSLQPTNMVYPISGKKAVFFFSRPVDSVSDTIQSLTTGKSTTAVPGFGKGQHATLVAGTTELDLPIDYLTAGQYTFTTYFDADGHHTYHTSITFTVY